MATTAATFYNSSLHNNIGRGVRKEFIQRVEEEETDVIGMSTEDGDIEENEFLEEFSENSDQGFLSEGRLESSLGNISAI